MHILNHSLATHHLQDLSYHALPFLKQVSKLDTHHLPEDVEVWQVELTTDVDRDVQDQEKLHTLLLLLNVTERERCLRYRRPADRIRFAVMRIVLQNLLAQHLDLHTQQIQIAISPLGKPYLAQPMHALHFNISHSQHIGLIALSTKHAIGIDIEAVYPLQDKRFLLKEILSAEEQHYCAQSQDDSAFFKCWTGKEAAVKAMGTGIQQPLSAISMLPTGELDYRVSLEQYLPDLQAWQLPVAEGYVASLALL